MDKKMAQLMEIVGKTNVFDNPQMGKDFSPVSDHVTSIKPRYMVKPKDVNEVQKIVIWANKTHTPLIPLSSGGPHFRGDTSPTVHGAVVVDLSGMKRILKIDRRNRLVCLEPGVTYTTLLPELQKEGLRIAMPILPRSNKSVLTSLLEREPVLSPKYQWNLLEPLRSLEIVWGNGDKIWSGSGVFRGEKEEDWKEGLVPVWGPGPMQLDYYKFVSAAQGCMGIVTWASVKCEVFPESRKLFFIQAQKLDDVIEFTYKLLKFRLGDELFIINNTCLGYIIADKPEEASALKATLPAWAVVLGITGGQILPGEKVEAQESDISDIARQFGLEMVPEIENCSGRELLELLLKPSEEPYWKLRYKGGAQEIFFLTTLDRTPGYVETMHSAADESQYPIGDIGVYIQPVHQGVCCHLEFVLPVDLMSPAESSQGQKLFRDASHRFFNQGAYFSRPYGIWADMVYQKDAKTMMVMQKVKEIFDQNNVMNPGKLCF
ncbi:MAG: FAD-binding oxidoreductase [Spirochaetota bacterium]|nr:MAG: FAD-binding oxidoreductase [Spirochaetota bacterium]